KAGKAGIDQRRGAGQEKRAVGQNDEIITRVAQSFKHGGADGAAVISWIAIRYQRQLRRVAKGCRIEEHARRAAGKNIRSAGEINLAAFEVCAGVIIGKIVAGNKDREVVLTRCM